jgi:cell wall assembly regulator SMI1
MVTKQTTPTPTVKASWQRIEAWLTDHAPTQAKSLATGATVDQIRKLESQLAVTLPEDFVESCSIHDGQKDDYDLIPDRFGTFFLLRLRDIPYEWELWNGLHDSGEFEDLSATPDKGVAAEWWNRGWIPFASNGAGDHLCIDLAPVEGGQASQIIKVQHDNSDRNLLAPSFAAWLGQLANALENGELNDFLTW